MSSRDNDKRKDQPDDDGSRRSRFVDVDPADIDRYLSGRSPRRPADSATSGTARQLERLQESVDRASRSRRQTQIDRTQLGTEDTSSSQTAYAAQSPLRSNRRQSYMREDPFVTDADEELQYESPEPTQYAADSVYEQDWEEESVAPTRAQPRRARRQPRQRPNIQRPTVPPVIANADIVNDTSALAFLGLSVISLAAMAIMTANKISSLPEIIPTHVSASGVLEHFATRSTLWQLPLLATMLTLMNLVAAWFISPLDRFASRFLLASSLIVQFVAWVALFRILW